MLSFVAAVTERVKLGTYVLLAPLRNPVVLLRAATTLDVLSNGRLILGLGLGWMKEEFEASRVPMSERAKRTEDTIRFMRKVWLSRGPVSYESEFIKMSPSLFDPEPSQKPVPIWIGGMTEPALRRAGRIGDGWLPNAVVSTEVLRKSVETISAEASRRGRDPKAITTSCRLTYEGTGAERSTILTAIEKGLELGVGLFIVDFGRPAGDDAAKTRAFAKDIVNSF